MHLKSLVDSYPCYKFVATGSAAAALRMESQESGAGRFSDFILPPLTFAEYLRFINNEKHLTRFNQEISPHVEVLDIDELNDDFINYLKDPV